MHSSWLRIHRATARSRDILFNISHSRLTGSRFKVAAAPPSDVFVLDFDGVLVDSEPEVSEAGVRAAIKMWPQVFASEQGVVDTVAALKPKMRQVRPVLVDGLETMVMARVLYEGCSPETLLSTWDELLPKCLSDWSTSREDLGTFLESFRREWMANESDEYLAAHEVYDGVQHTLQMCDAPFYIASSKKGHRVAKLMSELVGVPIPEDSPRLFAALLPPNERKADTLRATSLHFVDDRIETLEALAADNSLDRWKLYFAEWGYSTEAEKARARASNRIRSASLRDFHELLKWGVLMGVDDGCEPEPEEVQRAIQAEHGLGARD